jgi:hypothetical protein
VYKPFGKTPINSPKILLDMIFNTMNLDGPICIPKFEGPLQVVNRTWFNKNSKEDLNSKLNIKPKYVVDYVVEVL